MQRCIFCQGELEPTTQRCRQCGQILPVPAMGIAVQVVNARSKYCPHCGHGIRVNARFCGNCGATLLWLQEQPSSANVVRSLQTMQVGGNDDLYWLLSISVPMPERNQ
jgi:predicted amidophosphoribosyltransferase